MKSFYFCLSELTALYLNRHCAHNGSLMTLLYIQIIYAYFIITGISLTLFSSRTCTDTWIEWPIHVDPYLTGKIMVLISYQGTWPHQVDFPVRLPQNYRSIRELSLLPMNNRTSHYFNHFLTWSYNWHQSTWLLWSPLHQLAKTGKSGCWSMNRLKVPKHGNFTQPG